MRHDELADRHVESEAVDGAIDSEHEYGRRAVHAVARCDERACGLQSVAKVCNRCCWGQATMDAKDGTNLRVFHASAA